MTVDLISSTESVFLFSFLILQKVITTTDVVATPVEKPTKTTYRVAAATVKTTTNTTATTLKRKISINIEGKFNVN